MTNKTTAGEKLFLEISESEINAMKWLLLKGMEQTKSDRKFQVFERLSDDIHKGNLTMKSRLNVIAKEVEGLKQYDKDGYNSY